MFLISLPIQFNHILILIYEPIAVLSKSLGVGLLSIHKLNKLANIEHENDN